MMELCNRREPFSHIRPWGYYMCFDVGLWPVFCEECQQWVATRAGSPASTIKLPSNLPRPALPSVLSKAILCKQALTMEHCSPDKEAASGFIFITIIYLLPHLHTRFSRTAPVLLKFISVNKDNLLNVMSNLMHQSFLNEFLDLCTV